MLLNQLYVDFLHSWLNKLWCLIKVFKIISYCCEIKGNRINIYWFDLFSPQQAQRSAPRLLVTPVQQRWASSLPMNTVVLFVPQQEAWVVERMGRFHRILEPVSSLILLEKKIVDTRIYSNTMSHAMMLAHSGTNIAPLVRTFKVSYSFQQFLWP